MTDSDVSQDHYYMQTALNLSLRGQGNTWPNPSVGTIIVKNKNVIMKHPVQGVWVINSPIVKITMIVKSILLRLIQN